MILDCGPATAEHLARRLATCATLVWNGPLGAFEIPPFDAATNAVAQAAAQLTRDGKLLTATVYLDGERRLLGWLDGKTLPGVKALEDAA
jgi:phosphoglycerate kinase